MTVRSRRRKRDKKPEVHITPHIFKDHNTKIVQITAESREAAAAIFMEKYGYYPSH